MNTKHSIFIIITFVNIISTNILQAQVENSVYSMFGVGQIVDISYGINRSLGGTGIAFQSGRSINYLNPASYLGLLPNSIVYEVGIYGIYNESKNKKISQTDGNINVSYFSVSLYLANWWAFNLGFFPYSFVNYKINSSVEISGEPNVYEKNYKGTGGLNRIYVGNSFKIYKGLSVGFNSSYMFGIITQTETAVSNGSFTGYELKNVSTAHSFYLDYGLQYSISNKNWLYTIGLIYGASKKLNWTEDLEFIYNGTGTPIEQEEKLNIKIPQKLGLGISIKNKNFRAGFDYQWVNWGNNIYSNFTIKNSNRFSVGIEYSPHQKDNMFMNLFYRLGANYKSSYLEIDNIPINSFGINFSVGIPYREADLINISIEYGEEGTLNEGLIKNYYWMLSFNFSLHEKWLSRSQRD